MDRSTVLEVSHKRKNTTEHSPARPNSARSNVIDLTGEGPMPIQTFEVSVRSSLRSHPGHLPTPGTDKQDDLPIPLKVRPSFGDEAVVKSRLITEVLFDDDELKEYYENEKYPWPEEHIVRMEVNWPDLLIDPKLQKKDSQLESKVWQMADWRWYVLS